MGEQRTVLILSLILCFAVVSISEIGIVKAESTIYIRADGSVEGTDNIQRVGNVYTFTDNLHEKIVVEKDNIVVDGAGYTLEGDGKVGGIWLENRRNVTIKNMQITHFGEGIRLMGNCKNNAIIGNNITDNGHETAANGIWVTFGASNNTISGNNITNNYVGIFVYMGGGNLISENYITANRWHGVWIYGSRNRIIRNDIINNGRGVLVEIGSNIVHHNNFVNNTVQADIGEAPTSVNIWDDGYPSGGNYWSNYNGTDTDVDGIGDTPYLLNENNQDNYPLIAPITIFDAGTWEWTNYNVDVISNSTVSDFSFNPNEGALLRFNVDGESGTIGFCRVTIPKDLLNTEGNWVVLADGNSVTPTVNEDLNNTYLYFTYDHTTKTIELRGTDVIPEFPSWIILPLLITATLVAIICKKRLPKIPNN